MSLVFPAPSQFTVVSCALVSTGGTLSVTITWKEVLVLLLDESVTVYVTVVIPIPNASPESWSEVTVATPQLSLVSGSDHVAICVHEFVAVFRGMFAIPSIVGLMVSTTVMTKLSLYVLLAASVAVYVMVCGPLAKVEFGASPAVRAMLSPGQLSEAVGSVQFKVASQAPPATYSVVSLGIPSMPGSSSSVTVTVKLALNTLPEPSVT